MYHLHRKNYKNIKKFFKTIFYIFHVVHVNLKFLSFTRGVDKYLLDTYK